MNDEYLEELKELQDPDNWDWDSAQEMPPVKNPRASVRVAFDLRDFELVADGAEQAGLKLTEFIRTAALEKAAGQVQSVGAK